MLRPPFERSLVLTGPTGSGKSSLALELAPLLNAEIVAMDSMTLYRGMDIGTAKPSQADRSRVPHHLIDVCEPSESASVAWWLKQAEECASRIEKTGKQVLFVGGTPLYLKAMMSGLFAGPPADPAFRDALEMEACQMGSESLHRRLAEVDPPSAARIHPNDLRRVIRALEVLHTTGQPIRAWQQQWNQSIDSSDSIPSEIWLDISRQELYAQIDERVEEMFRVGLVEEVRRLRDLNPPWSKEASQALGYKEIVAALNGECTLAEAKTQIQTRSRNFAKRQVTWFRHLPGCRSATKELTYVLWQSKMKRP